MLGFSYEQVEHWCQASFSVKDSFLGSYVCMHWPYFKSCTEKLTQQCLGAKRNIFFPRSIHDLLLVLQLHVYTNVECWLIKIFHYVGFFKKKLSSLSMRSFWTYVWGAYMCIWYLSCTEMFQYITWNAFPTGQIEFGGSREFCSRSGGIWVKGIVGHLGRTRPLSMLTQQ